MTRGLLVVAVAISAPAIGACRASGAEGGPLAFVSNEIAQTVSVVSLATRQVVRTIAIQGRPRGIQVADGRLFVAVSDTGRQTTSSSDAIVELDPRTGAVRGRFGAGSDPEQFAVVPGLRWLVATNEDAGTATITDMGTGREEAALVVGVEPEGVTLSPDGRTAYVTAETSNSVSVIDLDSRRVVQSFLVDSRPRDAAFSPDGMHAYVTAEIGGSITEVDARRHRVLRTATLSDGAHPVGIVVSRDGRTLYVATGHGNTVDVIDADSLHVRHQIPVGRRPWGLALSADGEWLYSANGVSGDVSVISVVERRVVATISTGAGAWGIALLDHR
jgi:PQQ-dependent catabolism-associated beta-propeller protein